MEVFQHDTWVNATVLQRCRLKTQELVTAPSEGEALQYNLGRFSKF